MVGHVNTLYCDVSRIFELEKSLKALQTERQTMWSMNAAVLLYEILFIFNAPQAFLFWLYVA